MAKPKRKTFEQIAGEFFAAPFVALAARTKRDPKSPSAKAFRKLMNSKRWRAYRAGKLAP